MTRRPRLLIDTEALLRAWRNDGPARELVQRAAVRDFSLCMSTTILDEVEEVLARPRFAAPMNERQQFRRSILLASDRLAMFTESEAPRRSADEGDDHVIEAALRTEADIVVSQNKNDVAFTGYDVLTAAEACGWLRTNGPYGVTELLSAADRKQRAQELAEIGGGPHNIRLGADARFRELTSELEYTAVDEHSRFCALAAHAASELITNLVLAAGPGLLVEFQGGNFDFSSGTWADGHARDGAIPFDLIWYSSERAQTEAIDAPAVPTIADWDWRDEYRHRTLLAGALVVVLDTLGPFGEPDMRFLALVGEPLPTVPEISNSYRETSHAEGRYNVVHLDPAGFTGSMTIWLPGGPSAILLPTAVAPKAVDAAFRISNDLCRSLGWPSGLGP